ncbi:hypothetical protein EDEG_03787 [Edhazardia aedis USNM 41457]|uniref:Uncharacterized protein n=1 Tax=Edhazardia aedis (strain USNM 41457) TaxID=1003232 RepID=J9DGE7_EDHAE|nr:hypothetical protein EDEG_03787 [Edhazardia aedis USNM 41457]|eukprot:EJW01670.1 hypothetical protein EDEG_03787 [Edhazardia aedis USNM 41457]
MDKIFTECAEKFLVALNNYINSKINYSALEDAYYEYEMGLFDLSSFDTKEMRQFIHNFKKEQFKGACEFERQLRKIEEFIDDSQQNKVDKGDFINKIVSIGHLHGYTKKNIYGRNLPHFPVLGMLQHFEDEEEVEVKQDDEEFMFEF